MSYQIEEINTGSVIHWVIFKDDGTEFATFTDQAKAENTCRSMNGLTAWDPKLSVPVVDKQMLKEQL